MHEVFYTRDDVRTIDNKDVIMHRCNCVLVHHECHPHGHGTQEEYEKCAKQIVYYEGLVNVRGWLDNMANVYTKIGPTVLVKFGLLFQFGE